MNSSGAVSVTNASGAPAVGEKIKISYDYNSVGIMGALASNPTAWLEVSVDGSPLLPRQRLVAVPFANVAGTIQGENLSVDPVSGNVHVKNRIVFGDGQESTTSSNFGEWETKTTNVVHLAESDGFVRIYNTDDRTWMEFYQGNAANDTPLSWQHYHYAGYNVVHIPVKKGKYWKATVNGSIDWMPVGF